MREAIMRKLIPGTLLLVWLLLAQVSPASATIESIHDEDFCKYGSGCTSDFEYPVRQDRTTTLTVEGQYVDLSTGLEVTGSGVTVTSVSASSSKKTIRIAVTPTATPGLHTV